MKKKNRALSTLFFVQVVTLFGLLVWLWIRRYSQEGRVSLSRPEIELMGREAPAEKPATPPTRAHPPRAKKPAPARRQVVKRDDLKLVEGIGPKIASTLQAAGINTYKQLARARPERLKKILDEAGISIADPTTWPEQAALAAAEDWEALVELKSGLKGGRRVD